MVSILGAVKDLGRIRQIYVVLVRHGFGELAQRIGLGRGKRVKALPAEAEASVDEVPDLDEPAPESEAMRGEAEKQKVSLPERVRLVLMDLGPSFVKLGQIASTRPDVIPAASITELKKLQDHVNPLPFAEIKEAVETSLGGSLESIYESFEEKPLAAASIGQVHRAVLRTADGTHAVAVKVQRPHIRNTVARDVELLHALAAVIERTIPESRIYSPKALVEQFDRAITTELDFMLEAEHAAKFTKNFESYPAARFPNVFKEASSKTVLTLEFLPGRKVYDAISIEGHSGQKIAKAGTMVVMKMIFEDGFFHADPHPGNILISGTPDAPVIGLVDLGMVGRLTPEIREKTVDLMVAAVQQDYVGLADALYAMGTPTRKVDIRAYRATVHELAEKYLGRPLKEVDFASMLGDLVKGATMYGIEIPADFLLVGKALMTIDGIGKEIDPNLDLFNEVKPFFFNLLRKRYSPERVGMEVWRGFGQLSGAAYELPTQLREILDDLRLGRLTLQTSDPTLPKTVDRLGRRLFSGFTVVAFVVSGTWLLGHTGERVLAIGLLAFGVVFMIGHVARDLLRKN